MKKQDKIICIITITAIIILAFLHIQSVTRKATAEVVIRQEKEFYYDQLPTSVPTSTLIPKKWEAKPLRANQLNCIKKKVREVKFKLIKECSWSKKQQKVIWKICQEEHFSFETAIAQAKLESSWNAKAIGDDGQAWGAWQIHPRVWNGVINKLGYCREDMFVLEKACRIYIYIMKSHFKRWDNVKFALLAWRWGGDKAMQIVDSGEYSSYANEIVRLSQKYERRYIKSDKKE